VSVNLSLLLNLQNDFVSVDIIALVVMASRCRGRPNVEAPLACVRDFCDVKVAELMTQLVKSLVAK
jgi:hypothetical protein